MKKLNNTTEWVSREAVISHEDGYTSHATVWFNGSEVVAIEPHTVGHYETKKFHYYNRIMGPEVMEYRIDLDLEYEMSEDELLIAAAVIEDNCEVEISLDWLQ